MAYIGDVRLSLHVLGAEEWHTLAEVGVNPNSSLDDLAMMVRMDSTGAATMTRLIYSGAPNAQSGFPVRVVAEGLRPGERLRVAPEVRHYTGGGVNVVAELQPKDGALCLFTTDAHGQPRVAGAADAGCLMLTNEEPEFIGRFHVHHPAARDEALPGRTKSKNTYVLAVRGVHLPSGRQFHAEAHEPCVIQVKSHSKAKLLRYSTREELCAEEVLKVVGAVNALPKFSALSVHATLEDGRVHRVGRAMPAPEATSIIATRAASASSAPSRGAAFGCGAAAALAHFVGATRAAYAARSMGASATSFGQALQLHSPAGVPHVAPLPLEFAPIHVPTQLASPADSILVTPLRPPVGLASWGADLGRRSFAVIPGLEPQAGDTTDGLFTAPPAVYEPACDTDMDGDDVRSVRSNATSSRPYQTPSAVPRPTSTSGVSVMDLGIHEPLLLPPAGALGAPVSSSSASTNDPALLGELADSVFNTHPEFRLDMVDLPDLHSFLV